jgi:hypothetical protein
MNKKIIKRKITSAVLESLPYHLQQSQTVDEAMSRWWLNIRSEGGLRLTELGDLMFRSADIEYFDYEIETKSVHKGWLNFVLELNNKIPCPYFIHKQKNAVNIRIYDSKVAVLISLHGNIFSYIKATRERT